MYSIKVSGTAAQYLSWGAVLILMGGAHAFGGILNEGGHAFWGILK